MAEPFRTVLRIEAPPECVFAHFTDPALMVRWMGDTARLDAVTGGSFSVDINGVLIRGHYLRLEPPRLIEIAWGELGNPLMPPGATRLTIRLTAAGGGTDLVLEHAGLVPAEAEKHAIGWPHFLARLAVAAAGGNPGPDPFAEISHQG